MYIWLIGAEPNIEDPYNVFIPGYTLSGDCQQAEKEEETWTHSDWHACHVVSHCQEDFVMPFQAV